MKMKYNLEWLIDNFEKGENLEFVFFWGNQKSKEGGLTQSCFSQWWVSPFTVDDVVYHTAEHWMMAQKALLFEDKEAFEKIISEKSPLKVKSIGKQVQNFNEEIWTSQRVEIVVQGNLHKFSQNKKLKQYLIDTDEKVLVEASPVDKIWGIGLDADNEKARNPKYWKGLNLLGFALMEVRDLLQDDKLTNGIKDMLASNDHIAKRKYMDELCEMATLVLINSKTKDIIQASRLLLDAALHESNQGLKDRYLRFVYRAVYPNTGIGKELKIAGTDIIPFLESYLKDK